MKYRFLIFATCFLLASFSSFSQTTFRLFYLGGQSNMNGYGYSKDLPDSLNQTFENAYIFHGNTTADGADNGGIGLWSKLQAGHGTGFTSDGNNNKYADRFGVELSLAHRLQQLYPGERIAFIKYAKEGTSIDSLAAADFGSWDPRFQGNNGINQYDHFLTTVRNAMAADDIDGDGAKDILIPSGIIWMQGESDAAFTEEIATAYYQNLERLLALISAAFRMDEMPVVLGKIADSWRDDKDGKVWDYGELVQYAQEKYAREHKNAAIVRTTRYYKYSDPWHFDSAGYIDLGAQFAEAVYKLNEQ